MLELKDLEKQHGWYVDPKFLIGFREYEQGVMWPIYDIPKMYAMKRLDGWVEYTEDEYDYHVIEHNWNESFKVYFRLDHEKSYNARELFFLAGFRRWCIDDGDLYSLAYKYFQSLMLLSFRERPELIKLLNKPLDPNKTPSVKSDSVVMPSVERRNFYDSWRTNVFRKADLVVLKWVLKKFKLDESKISSYKNKDYMWPVIQGRKIFKDELTDINIRLWLEHLIEENELLDYSFGSIRAEFENARSTQSGFIKFLNYFRNVPESDTFDQVIMPYIKDKASRKWSPSQRLLKDKSLPERFKPLIGRVAFREFVTASDNFFYTDSFTNLEILEINRWNSFEHMDVLPYIGEIFWQDPVFWQLEYVEDVLKKQVNTKSLVIDCKNLDDGDIRSGFKLKEVVETIRKWFPDLEIKLFDPYIEFQEFGQEYDLTVFTKRGK